MYEKMQESGLIEIMPLMFTLVISSQDPVLPHLSSLRAHHMGHL